MLQHIKLLDQISTNIALVSFIESPNTVEVKGERVMFDQSQLRRIPMTNTNMITQHSIKQKTQPSVLKGLRLQYNSVNTSEVSVALEEEFQEYNDQNHSKHTWDLSEQRRQYNIEKLLSFEQLQDNWNGYGAKSFSRQLIQKCLLIIKNDKLIYQPDIFPTGRQSVQFEYENDESYLEFEIFESSIGCLYMKNDEVLLEREIAESELFLLIADFHALSSKYSR